MVRFKVSPQTVVLKYSNYSLAKNRWLLVEFIPVGQNKSGTNHLEGKHIWGALKQCILNNFGDTGWGAVGLSLTGKVPSFTVLTGC